MSKRSLKMGALFMVPLVLLGLLIFVWLFGRQSGGTHNKITLVSQKGNFPYSVELANTGESRAQGLSGRDGLAPDTGMLFVFGQPSYDCFWMKDMKFDIDMLWFDRSQSLVHVQDSVSRATYPSSFCPPVPASYVLEVPAGTAKRLGLQMGDHFTSP